MKYLLLTLFTLTSVAPATAQSSTESKHYKCYLERGSDGARPDYNKKFIFPFPTGVSRVHVSKGSMRWNSYRIKFHSTGLVEATVTEEIKGERVSGSKTHQIGKNLGYEDFSLGLELMSKTGVKVTYQLKCGPE